MRCPSLRELPPPPAGKTGWPWTEEGPHVSNGTPERRLWPRVSIVTPSYNQGEFLEETIRSVLLQGYPDLEYMIMDGGSEDESVEIIRKYERWLTCWVSQPDPGQAFAINKGWEHATGQILAYINSDDYYLPGAIAVAAREFDANPHAGMIYGSAIVIDVAGNELRAWRAQPFDLRTMLTVGSIVPQPATFFARSALDGGGYLDQRWHMIMDYELCVRVGTRFPSVCLPKVFAKFRDHVQSKTHSRYEDIAKELTDWLREFLPSNISTRHWLVIKRIMLSRVHYEWAINYLVNNHRSPRKALIQLIKSIIHYPLLALKRPTDTAYLIKEICLSPIARIGTRLNSQHKQQLTTRK